MEEFVKKYIQEANELIASLEENVLILEKNSYDNSIVDNIFRGFHTIKGGGAMFGFNNVSEVTHEIESIFDLVRNGKITTNKTLISKTLYIIDYLKNLINNQNNVDKIQHLQLIQELKDYKEDILKNKTNISKISNQQIEEKIDISQNNENKNNSLKTFKIFFKPNQEVFLIGN